MENLIEKNKKTIVFLLLYFGIIALVYYIVNKDLAKILGVFGLLTFSLQESFKYFLDRDIELYKLTLDKERIRYEELHTRKAKILEEFYNLIIEVKFSLDRLSNPGDDTNKKKYFEEAGKILYNFRKKFEKRKLYFNEELEKEIENLSAAFYEFYLLSSYYENIHSIWDEKNQESRQLTAKEIEDGKEKNSKIIKEKVPSILKNINKEFKNILG